VRKITFLLPLLLAIPAWPATTTTVPVKKATKPVKRKPARKIAQKKRPRPAVVAVSPQVRHVAFQAVSARATHPMGTLQGAGALVPFFEQISRPPETGSLHILHYGDSHTASDDWAAEMRQSLQAKFGAGGPGFTLAGHPFAGYRRFDSKGNNSRGWYTDGLVGRQGDGIYGLSGVSLTTQSSGQTVSLVADAEQIELHYLQQPAGGQLEFAVDGVPAGTIDTAGDLGPGIYRYTATAGSHEYVVTTINDGPVRLFGWVAQNHSGITYETLGINGAKAGMLLDWNQTILAGEMASRDPALIVVAYGTNEALSGSWTEADYRSAFTEVIHRLRADAPVASILVVGPPDCLHRYRGRRLPFPHLDEVIEIQRQVSLENGCAFWDWRSRMGGAGSVRQWVQAGLSQGDYVHFTGAGYRLVGDMLIEELMDQYTRFLAVRAEATNGQ
jgi:lysophospholipase L1-like esterase